MTALVLHGGGGPRTVQGIADHLAPSMDVILPTHPGWDGTDRPATINGIADLAALYLDLLAERDLTDVLVIGSSLGGWTAAEMAARDSGRIGKLVLIDAVGITVEGAPIRDFFALDPRGVAEYAWHDSERYYVDPATMPPAQREMQQANMATMRAIAGEMQDPTLAGRLSEVHVPTLVLWGESDRIVTPAYGRAFANAFGKAEFQVVAEAGHLPQLEQPAATFGLLDAFRME
ncbi:MAG TPA: alpha/beta hydrolase [Actinoplanes sp.]|jgi:pimeloyl-ACP methyl ester carboxylesterase|nr:alpha/beta hydrolase [Actinoplanes sp.]